MKTAPLLLSLAALLCLALPAGAQAPKVGDYFVDETTVGFKVKVPKKWDFVPGQPNEWNVIGKYTPTKRQYITLQGNDLLFTNCWLLRFDSSLEHSELEDIDPDDEDKDLKEAYGNLNWEDLETWIAANRGLGLAFVPVEEEPYKCKEAPATERLFKGKLRSGAEVHVWAVEYEIDDNQTVALVFNAPADKKDWSKWRRSLDKMARTFKRVEIERTIEPVSLRHASPRVKKKARLEEEVSRQAGWSLHETPNYFVTTNMDMGKLSDKRRIEELMVRLEAIREVYERDYPLEKALDTRRRRKEYQAEQERKEKEERAKKRKEGREDDEDDEDEEEGEDEEEDSEEEDEEDESEDPRADERTVEVRDPMEMSRTSVVRVCADRNEYHAYGGPPGSAGYWSFLTEELVFYGNASGGQDDVWIVLNHEAFHQYIFYFYGEISPHSWYNEGTGDFYSGYQIDRRNRFQLEPNDWRLRTIQVNLRTGKYAPLKTLVRWSQREYYGGNKLGLGGGENYAQGWSFIYFLRTGKENRADGWSDDWDDILEVYLDTLAVTGDLDKAVDDAFEGVDFDELEEAWKAYILDI